MATLVWFNKFKEAALEKKHDFSTDTLKFALSNTAPTAATNTVLANITQISAGNGYTTGGTALTSVTSIETGGVVTIDAANVVFTASGGSIGPFRYVVLYNDTATNDELVCYWDLGSSQSLADTQALNLNIDAAGIFTLS